MQEDSEAEKGCEDHAGAEASLALNMREKHPAVQILVRIMTRSAAECKIEWSYHSRAIQMSVSKIRGTNCYLGDEGAVYPEAKRQGSAWVCRYVGSGSRAPWAEAGVC
jgi:hypothetical protein